MWVLLFYIYTIPVHDIYSVSVNSQEFYSKESCEKANMVFEERFENRVGIVARGMCVEK